LPARTQHSRRPSTSPRSNHELRVRHAILARPSPGCAPGDATPVLSARDILEKLVSEALRAAGTGPRRVIAELTVPVSRERADLVVVGEQIWCYEIKSARDSLRRLPRQTAAFERVAHRCVLVVASKHLPAAAAQVPEHWGLVEAREDDGALRWHRHPEMNNAVDCKTLLRLLWRKEAELALRALDGEPRAGRRRQSLLGELWRTLDADSIEACVREALLRRIPYEGRIATHTLVV
jgi:hypothetical protein